MSKSTETTLDKPNDKDKAIYLLDHGWKFVEPRNQEENRAPHRYTKKNASGMSNMLLEDAYKLEKGNNDLVNSWQQ